MATPSRNPRGRLSGRPNLQEHPATRRSSSRAWVWGNIQILAVHEGPSRQHGVIKADQSAVPVSLDLGAVSAKARRQLRHECALRGADEMQGARHVHACGTRRLCSR